VQATKTINPLHFEDLEPKRFEDLVRQLAYSFKTWKLLEPTGLLGDDEGIDILGIEAPSDESAVERRWRFQCKRYKRLSPKEIRNVVREVVPDPASAPYGLVIAAACNFTSDAILAFHEEARKQGVEESHLWSKAKLEDQLFQPQHDHLLFAYFGISLRTRKRGELEAIRHAIAIKRKLRSALGVESLSMLGYRKVIVRNVAGDTYPERPVPGSRETWHIAHPRWADHAAVCLEVRRWLGWQKPDGTWDRDEASGPALRNWPQNGHASAEQRQAEDRAHRERVLLEAAIPKEERVTVIGLAWLPYSRILEIDEMGDGDSMEPAPHLFCESHPNGEHPYGGTRLAVERNLGGPEILDSAKRDRSLFETLRKRTDLSEEALAAHWVKAAQTGEGSR
jgi:hypothetical protein